MAVAAAAVLIDDRLLVEELLVGLDTTTGALFTTAYWYHRACRAAVLGAGGHLSGPFARLDHGQQTGAVRNLLVLREDIELPDPRVTIPKMVELSQRHHRLNLLNLEAAAAALALEAPVWLSAEARSGILPGVLDAEGITWKVIERR